MTGGNNRNAPPLAERLWPRCVRTSGGCLEWQGCRDAHGYGQISVVHGRKTSTHRAAWLVAHGDIPDGLWVLHHCDNPPCCEPSHLFLGTPADNTADMVAKGRAGGGPPRATHCPKGHQVPSAEDVPHRRKCVVCRRERLRERGLISARGRKVDRTRCPQGHPYDEANTYVARNRDGSFRCRMCRACMRDRARRRRAQKQGGRT